MLATGERTSIEIALENGSKFPVYAVVRLFSNIDCKDKILIPSRFLQVLMDSYCFVMRVPEDAESCSRKTLVYPYVCRIVSISNPDCKK